MPFPFASPAYSIAPFTFIITSSAFSAFLVVYNRVPCFRHIRPSFSLFIFTEFFLALLIFHLLHFDKLVLSLNHSINKTCYRSHNYHQRDENRRFFGSHHLPDHKHVRQAKGGTGKQQRERRPFAHAAPK